MADQPAHFVVERLNWRRNADIHGKNPFWVRLPGTTRVTSCEDPDQAEAERAAREAAARAAVNPFRCGPALHYQTSFDEDRLHDWILDAGLEPPQRRKKRTLDTWTLWWARHARALDELRAARVWEAFDKLRFFQVTGGSKWPVVYVVAAIHWEYNGTDYDAAEEGSVPQNTFRDRTEAEEFCQRRETEARQQWQEYIDDNLLQWGGRLRHQGDPFARHSARDEEARVAEDENTFYEVLEVELLDEGRRPAHKRRVYLVSRTAWATGRGFSFASAGDDCLVPEAAFLVRSHADQDCARRSAEARRVVCCPFRFDDFGHATSLTERKFLRLIERLGLSLPEPAFHSRGRQTRSCDWPAWWDSRFGTMTVDQLHAIWEAMDRLRFYQVREVTLEG